MVPRSLTYFNATPFSCGGEWTGQVCGLVGGWVILEEHESLRLTHLPFVANHVDAPVRRPGLEIFDLVGVVRGRWGWES